jgi:hypothetical protein
MKIALEIQAILPVILGRVGFGLREWCRFTPDRLAFMCGDSIGTLSHSWQSL